MQKEIDWTIKMKQIYESNIVKEIQNLVAEISNTVCKGMNNEEIKAYNFGIEQTLNMLQIILEGELNAELQLFSKRDATGIDRSVQRP